MKVSSTHHVTKKGTLKKNPYKTSNYVPFRRLSAEQKEKVLNAYLSERQEDSEWMWNLARDATYKEWMQNDENYLQFIMDGAR